MALLQAFTGINMQGDKQTRKQVYSLFDRGYTEKDVKAVIGMAADNDAPFPPPAQLFGPMFDQLITTPADNAPRDHYASAAACHKERTCIQWRVLNTPCRRLPKM